MESFKAKQYSFTYISKFHQHVKIKDKALFIEYHNDFFSSSKQVRQSLEALMVLFNKDFPLETAQIPDNT